MFTGVDLLKILGGQTKILGGKVVKSDKCMGIFSIIGGHVPGLPLKSAPMTMLREYAQTRALQESR